MKSTYVAIHRAASTESITRVLDQAHDAKRRTKKYPVVSAPCRIGILRNGSWAHALFVTNITYMVGTREGCVEAERPAGTVGVVRPACLETCRARYVAEDSASVTSSSSAVRTFEPMIDFLLYLGEPTGHPPSFEILEIFRRSRRAYDKCKHDCMYRWKVEDAVVAGGWSMRVTSDVRSNPEDRKTSATTSISIPSPAACCSLVGSQDDTANVWAAMAAAQHDEYEKTCCFWMDMDELAGYGVDEDEEFEAGGRSDEEMDAEGLAPLCSPAA